MRRRNSGGVREVDDDDQEKLVYDSSLDHKGEIPLRASTGAWRAAAFVLALEFSERFVSFGITINLITYLTVVLHQDLEKAAKMSNYFAGVTTITPLIGGFLGDTYTGRFTMIMFSSLIYFLGLSLLTMTEFIPTIQPCEPQPCHYHHQKKIHEVIFFVALYMLSVAAGGHKPCLESFGADQFDDDHSKERKQKMSFFNWWNFGLCCGLLLGTTLISYLQDRLGWGISDLILTVTMGIGIAIFYLGKNVFRYRKPQGSPLVPMLQVFVAAIRKRNLPLPADPKSLNEEPVPLKSGSRPLKHSNSLRFLDKAAIVEQPDDQLAENRHIHTSPWRLSTVTKVEETKLLVKVLPIWLTSLVLGLCMAQTSTFFVKQSSSMNRKICNGFEIPAASMFSLGAISMLVFVTMYEKVLVPVLRRITGTERGISILQRIGVGMILTALAMAVAAIVERKRSTTVENSKVGMVPMSVFWLAPQYIIIGLADTFSLVGLQECFYDQVPDSMRSLGLALYLSVNGFGSFLSSFLITAVDRITKGAWIGKDLNSSRLDKFYWLLTAIGGVNFVVYVFIARRFSYKNVQRSTAEVDGGEEA